MSFAKAAILIDLITSLSATRQGMSLSEIEQKYSVSLRTAQRMIRSLERYFSQIVDYRDADGLKRWRLDGGPLKSVLTIVAEELAVLGLAIQLMENTGLSAEADQLKVLLTKVMALLPKERLSRLEPDLEVLLETQGLAPWPVPKPAINNELIRCIVEAINSGRMLQIEVTLSTGGQTLLRKVAPLGLLSSPKKVLIGLEPESASPHTIRSFQLSASQSARLLPEYFQPPANFKLSDFAMRIFCSADEDDEPEEVCWRFSARAAKHAATIKFHPTQSEHWNQDGSLDIRFKAKGFHEMAWYLYKWGRDVSVLEPARLARFIENYQRDDFNQFP